MTAQVGFIALEAMAGNTYHPKDSGMKMFRDEIAEDGGIGFLDLGSSVGLAGRWKGVEDLIALIGFDPDESECRRMNGMPHRYHSAEYLPYAISDKTGPAELYLTTSPSCCSLIRPDNKWLNRFTFKDLFEVKGERRIETRRLDEVDEIKKRKIDVIKSDTQGMELPILSSAGKILDEAFEIEVETGFSENYVGETTFSMIDVFLRKNKFLMFDMRVHRIARDNVFRECKESRGQILWCESVWLKDYVAMSDDELRLSGLTRAKAIRALTLCALQKAIDFGYELAALFHSRGLITAQELSELEREETWKMDSKHRW